MDILKEEWDEKTLSWKPCGEGSMTKKPAASATGETPKEKVDDDVVEEKQKSDNLVPVSEQVATLTATEQHDEAVGNTHPYLKTLDTMLQDVISHAHLAANVCAGKFEETENVQALEQGK